MAEKLRLVLVTPETTLLDEPVDSLRFPLFDGQIGVLPGRAPMVGRLGYGELVIRKSSGNESFFIDGGFAQIKGAVVSLLTDRAIPATEVDASNAAEQLVSARSLKPTTEQAFAEKDRELQRARRLVALAKRSR
jgi:F-type H+-transporting ATPase subunit epsilon